MRRLTIASLPLAERCGDYAEDWELLGKPKGWLGCSLPKGHEGACGDVREKEADHDLHL